MLTTLRAALARLATALHLWYLRRQLRHLSQELDFVDEQLAWLPPHRRAILSRQQVMQRALDGVRAEADRAMARRRVEGRV